MKEVQGGLSVCVPVYNGERFLQHTLESISDQKILPDELLVADNGSCDSSPQIIKQFAHKYSHLPIRTIFYNQPLGMAADWNRLIRQTSFDTVMLLPADDVLESSALKTHYEMRNSSDISFSATAKYLIRANGNRLPFTVSRCSHGLLRTPEYPRSLICSAENRIGEPGCVAFNKRLFDKLGGFDESLRYYPDLDLWIKLLFEMKACFDRQPLVGFRIHSSSLSGPNQKLAYSEWLSVYSRHATRAGLPPQPKFVLRLRSLLVGQMRSIAIQCLT